MRSKALTAGSHLKPGTGRFEQVEVDLEPRCDDGTLPENATIKHWYKSLKDATLIAGRPIAYNHATRHMLAAQGFVDIEERVIRLPLSPWPMVNNRPDVEQRRLARCYQIAWLDDNNGLEAYSLGPLTRPPVSWPADDVKRYCKETAREMMNTNYHLYHVMYVEPAASRYSPSQAGACGQLANMI
ncbi:MAG: hypothetical protein Q9220_005609 [cf. Caloplaca sp. 1 TL-2023]